MTGRTLRVVVEADGGSRGNPGPAGYGAVVRAADTGEVLLERAAAIGTATNNIAEYSGLIAGLQAAADLNAGHVEVRMDSKLVVEQMSGRWQIKHPGLRPLAAEAARLVRRFDAVTFEWIPREHNRHADALANRAMDEAAGKPPRGGTAGAAGGGELEPPRQVAAADSPARAAAREAATRAAERAAGTVLHPTGPVAAGPGPAGAADPSPAAAANGGQHDGGQGWAAGAAGVAGVAGVAGAAGAAGAGDAGDSAQPSGSWAPPDSDTATRLVLVRHGETAFTEQKRYSGRGDVPLSQRGEAQVMAAATRVAGLVPSVAAVVTSPLQRCTRTAAVLAEALGGAPVVVEPDLVECDFGEWEGLTFGEVRDRWPAELTAWLGSTSVAPPSGESFQAVAKRTRRVLAALRQQYPRSAVVVVSHVSPIKLILRDALAAGDAFLHRLYLDAAGVSLLDTWPDGGIAVRCVNDTAHLR